MPVIEAQCASILVPHDHRHINHESASGRLKRARAWGGLLDGRVGDAECAYPPGHVDCVVLLKCLEYMRDKLTVLSTLRLYADRLVMRVNCQG